MIAGWCGSLYKGENAGEKQVRFAVLKTKVDASSNSCLFTKLPLKIPMNDFFKCAAALHLQAFITASTFKGIRFKVHALFSKCLTDAPKEGIFH